MFPNRVLVPDVKTAAEKLSAYCRANRWAGYDPYDAVNSRLFTVLPFLNSRLPRLFLTQALKRSPINVRGLLQIPQTQNPKAIALFLSAFLKAPELAVSGDGDVAGSLAEILIALRSPDTAYWCWGYSFPWQTRTIVVPRGAPSLVCTVFAAEALLDLYERRKQEAHLSMAVSAAEYLLNELYWTDNCSTASFSYPLPSLRSRTHNANFLSAALLCRIAKHTGDQHFRSAALRVARYSAAQQNPDGSWYYGEAAKQKWIDNFHTGYNLCALLSISQHAETREFDSHIASGFAFYRAHFFRKDGAVRYFHDRTYPIDIHCVAQSIITLLALRDLNPDNAHLAYSVFRWAMEHMWDDRGYFYYRVLRVGRVRTSYMRWSQAWMLLAMSTLLREAEVAQPPRSTVRIEVAKAC